MRHIFAAEIDDAKREYILNAYEDVEHVFGNVECFQKQSGWCYKCGQQHKISEDDGMNIDLLLCGPSCKDLSILARTCCISSAFM